MYVKFKLIAAITLVCLLISFLQANSQTGTASITGLVTDNEGRPIPYVTVTLKNNATQSTQTTQCDSVGQFGFTQLSTQGTYNLDFSAVGYESRTITGLVVKAGDPNSVVVSLKQTGEMLSDVVVVGYGTRQRQELTGSVSKVSGEVLRARPITNTLAGLQGEIPGTAIQRSSGKPGAENYTLNVRGYSSTTGGNSPLVLIDGVAGSLDLLNPDDVESITVLKDASASIYGSRAAGGVMIVTTKRGRRQTPQVSYSNNIAVTKLSGMMKSPTNLEMALMDNEANIHNGAAPMYTPELIQKIRNNDPNPIPHPIYGGWMLFFTNTDWVKEVFENGFQQKHTVNLSGGGTNSSYYLSGSFFDQRGVIKYAHDNNKRYNLRLNYDYDVFKFLKLETKVSYEHQQRTGIGGLDWGTGVWTINEAIFGMPNHPVYTPKGNFFAQGGWGNAVAQAKEAAVSESNMRNINTNIRAIVSIIDGLKLNLQTGINYTTQKDKDPVKGSPLYNWNDEITYYSIANPGENALTNSNKETLYKNFTGYFDYNKLLGGNHNVGVMLGASHEENDWEGFSGYRQNMLSDRVWSLNLGTTNMRSDGHGEQWALRSLFSRLSYAYKSKYLIDANFRYDGSSRFEKSHRWGFFPGISAAWRISKEAFMENAKFFNDLRLRASDGETGNQEGISLYDYLQLINVRSNWDGSPRFYPFGAGEKVLSVYLGNMVSLNRTWETLITKNIGLDASILSSRLNFTFDYFIKRNRNMLIPVTYPSLLGSQPPFSNSGELLNRGFETSLNWADKIGKLDYSLRFILSDSKNKLVKYGGADTYKIGLNYTREGYPLNTYFAYVFDGLIRTQAELDAYKKLEGVPSDIGIGDAKFKDVNGDGKISLYGDGNDGDVIAVGNTFPRYNYGFNINLKYANFDLGVFIQGVGKKTLFREGEYAMPWSDWWRQPPQFYFEKTWNEDRPNAEYPRLSHGNIRSWNYQPSTLQQINAAYARLKNVQVGYTIPIAWAGKIKMSNARIYFSGQDLWEIHKIKGGWDPESDSGGFNYPFQRFYSFGIDVTF